MCSFDIKENVCSAVLTLKKGEGRTIKAGGSWIYDNEVDKIDGEYKDGNILKIVDVFPGLVIA